MKQILEPGREITWETRPRKIIGTNFNDQEMQMIKQFEETRINVGSKISQVEENFHEEVSNCHKEVEKVQKLFQMQNLLNLDHNQTRS